MGYYKFTHETSSGVVKVNNSTSTWTDVADLFFNFLLGCGFVLDKQDLSDYYDERQFAPAKPDYQFAPEAETALDNHAASYGVDSSDE